MVHALPGVGENLQDHFAVHLRWRIKNARTFNDRTRGIRAMAEGLNYILRRKGVLTQPTFAVAAYIRTRPELASPDVQLQFFTATYKALGDRSLDPEPGVTIGACPLRLEGRGHVHCAVTGPHGPTGNLAQSAGDGRGSTDHSIGHAHVARSDGDGGDAAPISNSKPPPGRKHKAMKHCWTTPGNTAGPACILPAPARWVSTIRLSSTRH